MLMMFMRLWFGEYIQLPLGSATPFTLSQSDSIAISTKVRLLRSLVWSVVSYGCESWTLKKSDEKRINSFEMKAFRVTVHVMDRQEVKRLDTSESRN